MEDKTSLANTDDHNIPENFTESVVLTVQGDAVAQTNRSRLLQILGFVERVVKSPRVITPSKVGEGR